MKNIILFFSFFILWEIILSTYSFAYEITNYDISIDFPSLYTSTVYVKNTINVLYNREVSTLKIRISPIQYGDWKFELSTITISGDNYNEEIMYENEDAIITPQTGHNYISGEKNTLLNTK